MAYHNENNDIVGQQIQDENDREGVQNPWTFPQKWAGEYQNMIAQSDDAALKRLVKLAGPDENLSGGSAEELIKQIGSDRYIQMAQRAGNSRVGQISEALGAAENSPDPNMQLRAALYRILHQSGSGPGERMPMSTVDPASLPLDSTFTLQGHEYTLTENEDGYRVLKDGGAMPDLDADGIPKMPYDKGSLKLGSDSAVPTGDFVPTESAREMQPSAMQTDLLGQKFLDSSGIGEQQPMFHQPVDVAGPAAPAVDQRIAGQYDPNATSQLPGFRQGTVNIGILQDVAKGACRRHRRISQGPERHGDKDGRRSAQGTGTGQSRRAGGIRQRADSGDGRED